MRFELMALAWREQINNLRANIQGLFLVYVTYLILKHVKSLTVVYKNALSSQWENVQKIGANRSVKKNYIR